MKWRIEFIISVQKRLHPVLFNPNLTICGYKMPPSTTESGIVLKNNFDVESKLSCAVNKKIKSTKCNSSAAEHRGASKRFRHAYESENGSHRQTSVSDTSDRSEATDHGEIHIIEEISKTSIHSNGSGLISQSPQDPKSLDSNILTWAQCDLCSKWRQLPSNVSIDQNTAFSCSDVKGWNCDMPEEQASGQFELAQSQYDGTQVTVRDSGSTEESTASAQIQPSKTVLCPCCGVVVQVLEDHYRLSPQCQPPDEITPYWVSGLVLDLSDRIPYRAVMHKDMRIWRKFTSRARSCSTYRGATRQLLWFYDQLRQDVLCEGWRAARQDQFRRDCESCDDAQLAVQLVNQVELEAIDWVEIHRLWAQERGADAAPVASQRSICVVDGLGGEDKSDELSSDQGRSKSADKERLKRRHAAKARWDRCKAVREAVVNGQNGGGAAPSKVADTGLSGADDQSQPGSGSEEYTLGSLVDITLDDGEQAVAIITAVPEQPPGPDGGMYEVAFLDAQGLIVQDDRLRLPLPNAFVSMALPCPPCRPAALPSGWIPAAAGASVCVYIGPDGRVCKSKEEMLASAVGGEG